VNFLLNLINFVNLVKSLERFEIWSFTSQQLLQCK